MSSYPHPVIAREGWLYLGLATAAALVVTAFGGWWSLPFWLVAVFVLQFFRDPARPVPAGERLVLSPADGRVIAIATTRDPYGEREALKISVFMNVFNVHSNRAPVDGEVRDAWYDAGAFMNAALDKASVKNERNALWLRADAGPDVVCVQVAGLIARRILCYAKPGDRLKRGERFGFIRFGSRVDLYLPLEARVRVELGQKVSAGATIVAEL